MASDIVLITTRGDREVLGKRMTRDSITGTRRHSRVSKEEFCFFLSKRDPVVGHIRSNKSFVVNFLPDTYAKEASMCLNASSDAIDLFRECSFSKRDADSIDCAVVDESCSHLECSYADEKELKEDVMFVGKIVGDMHGKL